MPAAVLSIFCTTNSPQEDDRRFSFLLASSSNRNSSQFGCIGHSFPCEKGLGVSPFLPQRQSPPPPYNDFRAFHRRRNHHNFPKHRFSILFSRLTLSPSLHLTCRVQKFESTIHSTGFFSANFRHQIAAWPRSTRDSKGFRIFSRFEDGFRMSDSEGGSSPRGPVPSKNGPGNHSPEEPGMNYGLAQSGKSPEVTSRESELPVAKSTGAYEDANDNLNVSEFAASGVAEESRASRGADFKGKPNELDPLRKGGPFCLWQEFVFQIYLGAVQIALSLCVGSVIWNSLRSRHSLPNFSASTSQVVSTLRAVTDEAHSLPSRLSSALHTTVVSGDSERVSPSVQGASFPLASTSLVTSVGSSTVRNSERRGAPTPVEISSPLPSGSESSSWISPSPSAPLPLLLSPSPPVQVSFSEFVSLFKRNEIASLEVDGESNRVRFITRPVLVPVTKVEIGDEILSSSASELTTRDAVPVNELTSVLALSENGSKNFGRGQKSAGSRATRQKFRSKANRNGLRPVDSAASIFKSGESGGGVESSIPFTSLAASHVKPLVEKLSQQGVETSGKYVAVRLETVRPPDYSLPYIEMLENNVEFSAREVVLHGSGRALNAKNANRIPKLISTLATTLLYAGLLSAIASRLLPSGSFGMGQSRTASIFNRNGKSISKDFTHVTFDDVAGIDEVKEELQEIVDYLRSPAKYFRLGARPPRGVLLVGAPGTGKTLLAKAIAGEANVPFFSACGSEFVELYVGLGASRVREVFEKARKYAPSIVFIDEIDAVAKHRENGRTLGMGNDEREQTLNQLLAEMDGFSSNGSRAGRGRKGRRHDKERGANYESEGGDGSSSGDEASYRTDGEKQVECERRKHAGSRTKSLSLPFQDLLGRSEGKESKGGETTGSVTESEVGEGRRESARNEEGNGLHGKNRGASFPLKLPLIPSFPTLSASPSGEQSEAPSSTVSPPLSPPFSPHNSPPPPSLSTRLGRMGGFRADDESEDFSFDMSKVVIVLAATNRLDVIDPALKRPGRFDRIVTIDPPDRRGRERILSVHIRANEVPLAEEVRLEELAKATAGFTGADLANLVNEAALLAAREDLETVTKRHFEMAIERSIAGIEKKRSRLSPFEKSVVSVHEVGHALIGAALFKLSSCGGGETEGEDVSASMSAFWGRKRRRRRRLQGRVQKLSIIPRSGGALGFTYIPPPSSSSPSPASPSGNGDESKDGNIPKGAEERQQKEKLREEEEREEELLAEDSFLYFADELRGRLVVLLGGRAAEELLLGKQGVSTGAVDDLEKANDIARKCVCEFGMSESVGNLRVGGGGRMSMLGEPGGGSSDSLSSAVEHEIQRLLGVAMSVAKSCLKANLSLLLSLSETLEEDEVLSGPLLEKRLDSVEMNQELSAFVLKNEWRDNGSE